MAKFIDDQILANTIALKFNRMKHKFHFFHLYSTNGHVVWRNCQALGLHVKLNTTCEFGFCCQIFCAWKPINFSDWLGESFDLGQIVENYFLNLLQFTTQSLLVQVNNNLPLFFNSIEFFKCHSRSLISREWAMVETMLSYHMAQQVLCAEPSGLTSRGTFYMADYNPPKAKNLDKPFLASSQGYIQLIGP